MSEDQEILEQWYNECLKNVILSPQKRLLYRTGELLPDSWHRYPKSIVMDPAFGGSTTSSKTAILVLMDTDMCKKQKAYHRVTGKYKMKSSDLGSFQCAYCGYVHEYPKSIVGYAVEETLDE